MKQPPSQAHPVPEIVSLALCLSICRFEGPTRDRGCRGTDGTPANSAVTVSRNDIHGTQRMGFNNTFVVWLEKHDIKSIIHLLLWNTGLDWIGLDWIGYWIKESKK